MVNISDKIDDSENQPETHTNDSFTSGDLTLDDLMIKEYMSIRAVNICKDTDLTSLFKILEFYEKKGTFSIIRNCGSKTGLELKELCEKYKKVDLANFVNKDLLINKKDSTLEKIEQLNPIQKSTLNRFLTHLETSLDVRSINGLRKISRDFNPNEIFEVIFSEEFKFEKLRNIGKKSIGGLNKIKSELIKFIDKLLTLPKNEIIVEYTKLVIKTNFDISDIDLNKTIENAFDTNKRIKLFTLLNLLITYSKVFTGPINPIFNETYLKTNGDNSRIETENSDHKLTRERIRQIKLKISEIVENSFSFINNFDKEELINYGIDGTKSLVIIDSNLENRINKEETVNFNTIFYSLIFNLFLKKKYIVLGDNEVINGKRKTINKRKFLNCYLIKSEIYNNFDFASFVEDVFLKLNEKIPETYSLNFQGYLYGFLKDSHKSILQETQDICETILFLEFELIINSDGYVVFERNTKVQIYEYCYDILEAASRPMTISEIELKLSEIHPEIELKNDTVRSGLSREKDLFIYFGRSSTYGLKKWESEKSDIKGGTIREIVEEYLSGEATPIHISEILKYVKRYRPDTNEKNVLTNLKIDESKTFCIYPAEFVGLIKKEYSPECINFKKVKGLHFQKAVLNKMNGWSIEKVINYYIDTYGYSKVQVEFIIQRKINEGVLKLNIENKIVI